MIDVHEVFSTSITLDEVERANRDCASSDDQSAVRLCHASTLLPLKHERDHYAFIPFSPLLCAFYAGSAGDKDHNDTTSIYVVRIETDGSHSLVHKLDCPKANQKANSTPVLFYLNQGVEMRERQEKSGLGHAAPAQGDFVTAVDDLINDAKSQGLTKEGRDSSSNVALIYKAGSSEEVGASYISIGFNDGATFATPRLLVNARPTTGRGPVRTKPFLVRKGPYAGRVLFPSSVDSKEGLAFADYSDDDLRTIAQSNAITPDAAQKVAAAQSFAAYGVVQAALYEDLGVHAIPGEDTSINSMREKERQAKFSRIHMMMSASGSQLFVADSDDAGATWGKPYPIPLYNCNAGIDVVTYLNRLLCCGKLVTNPEKCDYRKGAPLAIYMSKDGHNFSELLRLEDEPLGTFTTPYMQVDRRHNLLYVSYTDHRKAIKIRIFRLRLQD